MDDLNGLKTVKNKEKRPTGVVNCYLSMPYNPFERNQKEAWKKHATTRSIIDSPHTSRY